MNLIIDQGNTNIKFFYFSGNKIKKKIILPTKTVDFNFLTQEKIDKIIYSTVSGHNENIIKHIKNKKHIYFTAKTNLPIINEYQSRTIGLDRLAAVVGASKLYPEKNILVIDVGSAVTYDFITEKKIYTGGNISPGLKLRYNSLNDYTKNLPLFEPQQNNIFMGNNTKDAIIAGVQNGLLFEIEKYIEQIGNSKTNFISIITGGDANFFEKIIKSTIFAQPNLVATGLNEILNYNIEE
ncbi:MAG: type III pantothenate kinase [Bacteroidales bacterium]|nr:type III pantothenate kinase [Bacteroidales bacterium]